MTPNTSQPAGVIHDLAYRRYEGARLGAATRFTVIARYAVILQWRLRAVKLFLVGALVGMAMGAMALGFRLGFSRIVSEGGEGLRGLDRGADAVPVAYALSAQYLPSLLLVLVCGAHEGACEAGELGVVLERARRGAPTSPMTLRALATRADDRREAAELMRRAAARDPASPWTALMLRQRGER